jgi:hypothetical protein
VGEVFVDVGLGLGNVADVGLGLDDDAGVGDGEACSVGEVVGTAVARGPHAVAIVATATSHTTDLRLSLEHSLKEQTVQRPKRFLADGPAWRGGRPVEFLTSLTHRSKDF